MEIIKDVIAWLSANTVELIALGWALEKVLEIVGKLTPWTFDDNLGVIVGKLLARISKRPQ
jgi:hypothetical protein